VLDRIRWEIYYAWKMRQLGITTPILIVYNTIATIILAVVVGFLVKWRM
jgi:hypothetical protein